VILSQPKVCSWSEEIKLRTHPKDISLIHSVFTVFISITFRRWEMGDCMVIIPVLKDVGSVWIRLLLIRAPLTIFLWDIKGRGLDLRWSEWWGKGPFLLFLSEFKWRAKEKVRKHVASEVRLPCRVAVRKSGLGRNEWVSFNGWLSSE
jgi:hypothetical protein